MLMLNKQKIGTDSDSWSPIYFHMCLLHLNFFLLQFHIKNTKIQENFSLILSLVGACFPYFNNVQLTTENLPQIE